MQYDNQLKKNKTHQCKLRTSYNNFFLGCANKHAMQINNALFYIWVEFINLDELLSYDFSMNLILRTNLSLAKTRLSGKPFKINEGKNGKLKCYNQSQLFVKPIEQFHLHLVQFNVICIQAFTRNQFQLFFPRDLLEIRSFHKGNVHLLELRLLETGFLSRF